MCAHACGEQNLQECLAFHEHSKNTNKNVHTDHRHHIEVLGPILCFPEINLIHLFT